MDSLAIGRDAFVTARITLCGHVQGVGFRPFVYRIAREHGLTGEVRNRSGEVDIVATGTVRDIDAFRDELLARAPPLSKPELAGFALVDTNFFDAFTIVPSETSARARIFVPPDYFMCDDCRRELTDEKDRRYRYPFINCTQCGPRYTLIRRMPYDRPNTSMAAFPLCEDCEREYTDPDNRRFHAEPVACPACGPSITLESTNAARLRGDLALNAAAALLQIGRVVAVKGVGGYHLLCDAGDASAVARLRRRKSRPDKPLAVMFPLEGADGLSAVRRAVVLDDQEAELLTSPARPIVLATRKKDAALARNLAPGLAELGVFLPYSPLHQLLLDAFDGPLVATSGNISGEPVLTDNEQARRRLIGIADAFLHHDRPIVRPADDPVFRRIASKMRPIRLGRGAAPLELELPWAQAEPVLAVGGHMKNAVALSWDRRAVVSPHIGEMDSPRSLEVFEQVVLELQRLYGVRAKRIVCDAHPGYTTHRWAEQQAGIPVTEVWHHHAHASAVAGEFDRPGAWLVFTWDGVGLGEDGTLWGGEALLGRAGAWRRVASFRPFHLPGGERAGRQPWRSAAALAWAAGIDWDPGDEHAALAFAAWQRRVNCPETSAAGRLFDAASAMILGCHQASFEAQGPMQLEACSDPGAPAIALPVSVDAAGILRSDWAPLVQVLMDTSMSTAQRGGIFHASLAATLAAQAAAICGQHDVAQVGLAGGVFQNRLLTEQVSTRLEAAGYDVYIGCALPANDAALSFGQAAELAAHGAGGD